MGWSCRAPTLQRLTIWRWTHRAVLRRRRTVPESQSKTRCGERQKGAEQFLRYFREAISVDMNIVSPSISFFSPHSLSLSKNLYYDWSLSSLSHPKNLNPKGNPSLCQLFLVTKLHANTTLEQQGFFFFFFKSLQLLQGVKGVRKEVFLQMACGDF